MSESPIVQLRVSEQLLKTLDKRVADEATTRSTLLREALETHLIEGSTHRTTNPNPVQITVCSVCDLPWSDHEAMARDWDEDGNAFQHDIRVEFCIHLLKNRNQGPPSAVGPMGMSAP